MTEYVYTCGVQIRREVILAQEKETLYITHRHCYLFIGPASWCDFERLRVINHSQEKEKVGADGAVAKI